MMLLKERFPKGETDLKNCNVRVGGEEKKPLYLTFDGKLEGIVIRVGGNYFRILYFEDGHHKPGTLI